MTKQYVGTTLTYDVRAETYLRTEVYESDDPGETVELRIIEPESDKTPKTITRGERQEPHGADGDSEPILLRPEDRKIERQPPQQKPAGRERRKTRVLPSQRVKRATSGRPKMVISDRDDPGEESERNAPPPIAERTLDGLPFLQRNDD